MQGFRPSSVTLTLSRQWLGYGFCIPSHSGKHFAEINENLSMGSGNMKRTRKCYGQMDGQIDRQTKGIPITPFRFATGD